ncbi:glycosyltransferase [Tenacibaculum sp. nBUS_03]|uniref:glycosyltransferase n=1 Tax=Tenacibaculum sp. nBUS_03 TaxID=3395320 RepID=UPI003EC14BDE
MMKKYILFGDASYNHVFKWYEELKLNFEVHVVTFAKKSDIPFKYGNLHSIEADVNSEGGNKNLILLLPKIKKIFKNINPVIVNAHYLTSYGFLSALLKNRNNFFLIQSTWGTDILVTPKKNILYKIITKYSLNKGNLITSDSLYMTEVINSLSKNKVLTFPMGLKKENLKYNTVKNSFFTFLSLRTLNDNSQVDIIIKAFSLFVKNIDNNSKLLIAHRGEKEEELKTLVKKLHLEDQVIFLGFLKEKEYVEVIVKSNCYISIPKSDALSVSLLETMAAETIPLVSNIPANKEFINLRNGFILPQNNENSLFLQMKKIYSLSTKEINEIYSYNKELILKRAMLKDNFSFYIKSLEVAFNKNNNV